jgi:hypothetical protein
MAKTVPKVSTEKPIESARVKLNLSAGRWGDASVQPGLAEEPFMGDAGGARLIA